MAAFFSIMEISSFYQTYFKEGNVTTDTRKIAPGDIFIALKGENFNGNRFAADAIRAGASVAVVDEDVRETGLALVRVDNCLNFLQQLGNYHRKSRGFNVIAITGTNGKTTTKELLHSVLKQKFTVQATEGNLNNHIGVPLTLLSICCGTDIAIVEMGANHEGEISTLCSIAEPDCGLITNIGKAHLEGFGDLEGVKRAKSELYSFLKLKGGSIFINASDPILMDLAGSFEKLVPYNDGKSLKAEIRQTIPRLEVMLTDTSGKAVLVRSGLFGEYNLNNMLAAAAVGRFFNIDIGTIGKGIESYIPKNFRSQVLEIKSAQLILDCYNANPTSMNLAIREFLRMEKQNKIAILGSMKELGPASVDEHAGIIELLHREGMDNSILIGSEFKPARKYQMKVFNTAEEAIPMIGQLDLEGAAILLKGSRANQLEKLQHVIQQKLLEE
ncbi:MAG: UDP-N-acetylmuramoyl-tripeptide--D-alanyl-D-alanine ligase [Bacteroidales bacterium]|nr:UDP-N-acetylmuramoyl-tripeptide--D-alanyl-D-alanine ligase [Bacteroidales bacterium]